MKRAFFLKAFPLAVLIGGLVVTLVTSAQNSNTATTKAGSDTIPKKQKQIRDLDEALIELEKGEMELTKAMKDFDSRKLEKEIREAMKNVDVDMAKMKEEMTKAFKEVDMQKINVDVQKALATAQKELSEVDFEKINKQVQASLAKVDRQKIKVELEELKKIDVEKMRKELEEIRPTIERSMETAKKEIEKARKEMTTYKNLVEALEKDGHLKKDENYKIEYKDGELTVNGKKLSADQTKKYSEYLSEKKNFTVQKEDDNLNINHK